MKKKESSTLVIILETFQTGDIEWDELRASVHCDKEDGCRLKVNKTNKRAVDEDNTPPGRKARHASSIKSLFQASTPDKASTAVSAAFNQGNATSNGPLVSIMAADKVPLSTACGFECTYSKIYTVPANELNDSKASNTCLKLSAENNTGKQIRAAAVGKAVKARR